MKKWLILSGALLLAFAGGLKFQQYRASFSNEAGVIPGLPARTDPLPGGSTLYYIPSDFSTVPTHTGAPSTYGALPAIKEKRYDTGSCKGGSLNEILSSHGRIWGYLSRYGAFESAENVDTYDKLGRYLACVGLARRDPAYCDYLPAESRGGEFKVDFFASPNFKCREYYMNVSFPGFAAGRDTAEASCRIIQTGGNAIIGPEIPGDEFCAAASKGMEGLCGALTEYIPAKLDEKCRRALPAKKSDCGSDRVCSLRLAVYGAMKADSAESCPEDHRALCSAFLSRTEASCSALLADLGTSYCGYLAKAQKRAGGYAGYSPQEVKAAFKKEEETKAWAEKQRLETQKITEEVNQRARKIMGTPEKP